MTTEKLTEEMMQSVQSEQTITSDDTSMEQSSEKPVKQKKLKVANGKIIIVDVMKF